MNFRLLTTGLQRLTLCTPRLLSLSTTTPSITPLLRGIASAKDCLQKQLITPNVISSNLHTSSVCQRSLDSRRKPPYKFPSHKWGRWEPRKKMTELYPEYTIRPLPFPKTGGRGPNGRIWNHRRGGGHKRNFRMIDWVRGGPTQGVLVERVSRILYDPNRSARIALVVAGEQKRYIIATQNMKAGDLIKSTREVTKTAVRAAEGDSYPLGSLPVGTLINNLELFPDAGALKVRAAGTQALLVRKLGDTCIVRLPSKREINVSSKCVATVGRVSNINHNKRVIGKAGRNRWLGFRPRSGRWHRKDGRFGRKIKPIKKMITYDKPKPPKGEIYRMSF